MMHWKPRGWTLIGMLLLAIPAAMTVMKVTAAAQATSGSAIATTQVTDTVYRADGTPATGTVIVSWQAFTTASGQAVPSGTTSATITSGALSLQLVPNAGSTPMGTYYTAVYHLDDGSVSREFWAVPVSQFPVLVSAIRTTVLPTSVAMQTVSKSYVDTAIAAAVSGHPLDSSSPFVMKTGDTMTGALVLPGDPTTPNDAADKHYVDASLAAAAGSSGGQSVGAGSSTGAPIAGATADYNFLQGSGTVLTDNSGNGNNGTLGTSTLAPTWTPTGLAFTGQEQVSLPSALNTSKTWFLGVYINPVSEASFSNQYPMLVGSSLGGNGLNLLTIGSPGQALESYTGIWAPMIFGGGNSRTAVTNLVSGFHVFTYVLGDGGSSVDHIYIDGVETSNYDHQGSSAGLQTSGNLFLGSSNFEAFTVSGLNGTYYRVAVVPGNTLTAAQILAISGQIRVEVAGRGVATGPLPNPDSVPTIHAIGDSITFCDACDTPSQAWVENLSLTNQPAYKIINHGVIGLTLEAMAGSEANRVVPQCHTLGGPSVAIVFGGTNDLINGTVATTLTYLSSEVQQLKAAGCRVFVGTMLSRGGNAAAGPFDTFKDNFDAQILTQAKAYGADGVVDFAANPLMGADGANANSTYFQPDFTHPKPAGQLLMAAAASNALNYYFGSNAASPTVVTAATHTIASGEGYVTANPTSNQTLTLPDCTGQSGATYTVANIQSAFTVSVVNGNSSQLINGLADGTAVSVPSNSSVSFRDVPNPKTVSGCHWEK